ncbi:NADPH-dependent FMN reductase [Sphingomonas sp.]|uniref:NADPH-dependent FMN reductase n=1 Tax=Sphingomonas sp. TaxID=28214 RepID=UPI003D6D1EC0
MDQQDTPLIVAIGGTQRLHSSSASALRFCLAVAERLNVRTRLFCGSDILLPVYDPADPERSPEASALVAALREADGVILASPGYHGGVSGLVKNAIDYIEDMSRDDQPYLSGRAVGCIAAAAGWQAGGAVLSGLRASVHALRGWPTPLGVQLNTAEPLFDAEGGCLNDAAAGQLVELTRQIIEFADMRRRRAAA